MKYVVTVAGKAFDVVLNGGEVAVNEHPEAKAASELAFPLSAVAAHGERAAVFDDIWRGRKPLRFPDRQPFTESSNCGASKKFLKVNASSVGPACASLSRRCLDSRTVGIVPAGCHQSARIGRS